MNRKCFYLPVIGAGLALIPACRPTSTNASKSLVPLTIEIDFDPTPRNADVRARIAAATIPEIAEGSTGFVLRCVDHKTDVVCTTAPQDEDAAYKILRDINSHMSPGTDLCSYWETLADLYERASQKVLIVIYTDGKDDGTPGKTATRIQKAAARLAANPNVQGVILVGTVCDTRPGWSGISTMLAPLKTRLHVIPQADMTQESILEEVEVVRTQASHR